MSMFLHWVVIVLFLPFCLFWCVVSLWKECIEWCWALRQGQTLLCRRVFFSWKWITVLSISAPLLQSNGTLSLSAVCLVVSMLPTSDRALIFNNHKLSCGLSNMTKCSLCAGGGLNANFCPAVRHLIVVWFITCSFVPKMVDNYRFIYFLHTSLQHSDLFRSVQWPITTQFTPLRQDSVFSILIHSVQIEFITEGVTLIYIERVAGDEAGNVQTQSSVSQYLLCSEQLEGWKQTNIFCGKKTIRQVLRHLLAAKYFEYFIAIMCRSFWPLGTAY